MAASLISDRYTSVLRSDAAALNGGEYVRRQQHGGAGALVAGVSVPLSQNALATQGYTAESRRRWQRHVRGRSRFRIYENPVRVAARPLHGRAGGVCPQARTISRFLTPRQISTLGAIRGLTPTTDIFVLPDFHCWHIAGTQAE